MILADPFSQLKSKEIRLIKKKAKADIAAAESTKKLLLFQAPEIIQQALEREMLGYEDELSRKTMRYPAIKQLAS